MKSLMKNSNYRFYIFGSGIYFGAYNMISVALAPLIMPYGFTSVIKVIVFKCFRVMLAL